MLIYNVTIMVADAIEKDWLNWMKTVHIPDVMNTGLFTENHFCKITFPTEGEEGYTKYAIQYWMEGQTQFDDYQEHHAKKLQAEHTKRYHNQFMAIRSILETVD